MSFSVHPKYIENYTDDALSSIIGVSPLDGSDLQSRSECGRGRHIVKSNRLDEYDNDVTDPDDETDFDCINLDNLEPRKYSNTI